MCDPSFKNLCCKKLRNTEEKETREGCCAGVSSREAGDRRRGVDRPEVLRREPEVTSRAYRGLVACLITGCNFSSWMVFHCLVRTKIDLREKTKIQIVLLGE